jgi:hypothetical protein
LKVHPDVFAARTQASTNESADPLSGWLLQVSSMSDPTALPSGFATLVKEKMQ